MIFRYELSQEADNDLVNIYDYTITQFGDEQAVTYLSGLENSFDNLCRTPLSGRNRSEIREGLRSIAYVSHIIFYRLIENKVWIVRILHSSRDIIRLFPPED